MKVAYLITAYGEWEHLERLVGALDCPGTGFFIHIDARSRMPEGLEERLTARGNVVFAQRRAVWWGGWSHTEAILELMAMAAGEDPGGGWDYCVVMSGGDYPLRSNRVIFETLAQGGEFINAAPGFRADKPENRVARYWLDGFDRRRRTPRALAMRGVEMLLGGLGIRKRRYPFERVWAGIVWSALSGACVRYILDYVRENPRYVEFFRTALVPEEMFFATIVGGSPYAAGIRGTLTYMDWGSASGRGAGSPTMIGAEHLPRLAPGKKHRNATTGREYERLFARKFDHTSGAVLDAIDRWRQD